MSRIDNGKFPKPAKFKNSYEVELKKATDRPVVARNDLRVKWLNPKGEECKLIQTGNSCFCGHQLVAHSYHESNTLHCRTIGCNCQAFEYMPVISMKCICKHSSVLHRKSDKRCEHCANCLGFTTYWRCKCGYSHVALKIGKENINRSVDYLSKLPQGKNGKAKKQLCVGMDVFQMQRRINETQCVGYEHKLQEDERGRQEYLRGMLKQANQRYFSKFGEKSGGEDQERGGQEMTAMDLYIQPHFYKNVSLTDFIKKAVRY